MTTLLTTSVTSVFFFFCLRESILCRILEIKHKKQQPLSFGKRSHKDSIFLFPLGGLQEEGCVSDSITSSKNHTSSDVAIERLRNKTNLDNITLLHIWKKMFFLWGVVEVIVTLLSCLTPHDTSSHSSLPLPSSLTSVTFSSRLGAPPNTR